MKPLERLVELTLGLKNKTRSKIDVIRGAVALSRLKIDKAICDATGDAVDYWELISEVIEAPYPLILTQEDQIESLKGLKMIANVDDSTASLIVRSWPIVGLLALIINRCGILNKDLTLLMMTYYCCSEKEDAQHFSAIYCQLYLDSTINKMLKPGDRYSIKIIETKDEDQIKIRVASKAYGYEFNTPLAMPQVVTSISQREFGIN